MLRAGIAIVCLLAVPVILPAQSCPGAPDYPEITGSLACPDGADSTVYSSAVPVATPEEPFNPDRSATIDSPPEVGSGSRFYVEWSGPANAGDYIAVAAPGSSGGDYRNYSYVEDGSPLQLVAPDEPGDYEVRYVQRDSRDILARQEVAVSEAAATVEFVSQIDSGSNFDVTWTGPGTPSDYIAIAAPDTVSCISSAARSSCARASQRPAGARVVSVDWEVWPKRALRLRRAPRYHGPTGR